MNKIPSPILDHKFSYEILYDKVLKCFDFKTFGTLYVSTLLLGTQIQSKGYCNHLHIIFSGLPRVQVALPNHSSNFHF